MILNKAILKQSLASSLTAGIGIILSLLLVLLVQDFLVQLRRDIKETSSIFGKQQLVIQKEITGLHTLGIQKSHFTEEEIIELEQHSGVLQVGKFQSAQYRVHLTVDMQQFTSQNFSTELFFQSIPEEFLQINHPKWNWDTLSREIPIVLPKDYLHLFNYGFAASQGLPQIPESMFEAIPCTLYLQGNNQQQHYQARVISFSENINTILVPHQFLSYSNSKFGNKQKESPTRLILKLKEGKFKTLEKHLEKRGFDLKKNALKMGKISYIKHILALVLLIIAFALGVLSISLFYSAIRLNLNQNKDIILLLAIQGVSIKVIIKTFMAHFMKQLILFIVFTFIVYLFIKTVVDQLMPQLNLLNGALPKWNTFLILGILLVSLHCFLKVKIAKQVAKHGFNAH